MAKFFVFQEYRLKWIIVCYLVYLLNFLSTWEILNFSPVNNFSVETGTIKSINHCFQQWKIYKIRATVRNETSGGRKLISCFEKWHSRYLKSFEWKLQCQRLEKTSHEQNRNLWRIISSIMWGQVRKYTAEKKVSDQ